MVKKTNSTVGGGMGNSLANMAIALDRLD